METDLAKVLFPSTVHPWYLSCVHIKSEITNIAIYWEACVPDSGYMVYSFLITAVTNNYNLNSFKQHKLTILMFWRSEV